ncbi:MAG: PfkB family carbohydrate kinase [Pseudomonadota bacterium]
MNSENKEVISEIKTKFSDNEKIVFVSGNFNVVHPGHLRMFDFAASCGDILIVGLNRQGHGNTVLPEDLRLESIRKITGIDMSFILPSDPEDFIRDLKPDVVVKGKEHEKGFNPELSAVESYGGRLLFSSGDVRFSSLDLLQKELEEAPVQNLASTNGYQKRHHFNDNTLQNIVTKYTSLEVVVVGDLIVDEYITCDPLGMSQEDPTLVVSPLKQDCFVGGAGIVAAHACGLGAKVSYFGVCGNDHMADFTKNKMNEYGVDVCLLGDESRPTSLKQRYRAGNKTLLRVSHLRQHDISQKLIDELYDQVVEKLKTANLLIFSDFNYGCLPQELVDRLTTFCQDHTIMIAADSQSSSQIGDVSRFKGAHLITPTEREARIATQDQSSGLVVLSELLREKAAVENIIVTLGAEGVFIHAPHTTTDGVFTDRLPALNLFPKDVAGAGDSLLTATAMALASGATIWQAAYIGSLAAAYQVGRIGNRPVQATQLLQTLESGDQVKNIRYISQTADANYNETAQVKDTQLGELH